ncbi:MAG TPA: hypothetical protein VF584_04360 [Longimicrobium sp.]|jgi:hypothetical protein
MHLRYDLHEHGWATVTLRKGSTNVSFPASYISDPLRDLALQTLALLRSEPVERVVFMEEPGQHDLRLERIGPEDVDVSVEWHEDHDRRACGRGKVVFRARTSVRRFAEQVSAELERLWSEHGADGYRARWMSDFPEREHRNLHRLVQP